MKILKVNGMRCGHCKAAVEEAAAKIPGVSNPWWTWTPRNCAMKALRSMRPPCVRPSSTSASIPNNPTTATSFSGRACGLFVPKRRRFSLENIL